MPKVLFTIRMNLNTERYDFDSLIFLPPAETWELMKDEKAKAAFKALAPEEVDRIEGINQFLGLPLQMRLQYNNEIRGPYVVDLNEELDEDDLLGYINGLPLDDRNRWLKRAYAKHLGGRP